MPSGAKPPPGPLSRSLGAILRGRAARLDIKLADIAASVNISRSQLSKMLRGVAHIDVEQLAAISTHLGLDPVDVLGEAWQELRQDTPVAFVVRDDEGAARRAEAEAILARAAADAGVSRMAARGAVSPETMREIAALMARHLSK